MNGKPSVPFCSTKHAWYFLEKEEKIRRFIPSFCGFAGMARVAKTRIEFRHENNGAALSLLVLFSRFRVSLGNG